LVSGSVFTSLINPFKALVALMFIYLSPQIAFGSTHD